MNPRRARVQTPKRYELVASALRANIVSGQLPPGLVLLEGPIAEWISTSRAPVQGALRILEDEGHIHRFEGRGYLVGPPGAALAPVRRDLANFKLAISNEVDSGLQNRGLWERVYDEVEAAVAACLAFGDFRIVEAALGDYYGVSRTVVRDVLARLHERGLVTKTQSSHWVASALTAQSVRERFALRQLLEPEALRLSAERADYDRLRRVLREERRADPEGAASAEELDKILMEYCLSRGPNRQLIELINQVRLPLAAASRALTKLGLPEDRIATREYLTLFDLIGRRSLDAAAVYWRGHLKMLAEKNLARLKLVAVITVPPIDVPYLTPQDV
jgi:DNA-binding GntR family transcriptional regulator